MHSSRCARTPSGSEADAVSWGGGVGEGRGRAFAEELEEMLGRLRAGRLRVRIAPQEGLYRRRTDAHFHPTAEFFLQVGGGTDFDFPGGSFRLGTGECCVVPRGVPHAERPIDLRTPYRVLVAMLNGSGFTVLHGGADARGKIQCLELESYQCLRGKASFSFLDCVSESGGMPKGLKGRYVESLVEAFALALLAGIARGPKAAAEGMSSTVAEAQKIARARLPDPGFSVGEVARQVGCTSDHLARLFRRDCGVTPAVWLARERVMMAKDLLTNPAHNVAEVAWACGFSSPSYFIRVFRAQTGQTPGEYRIASALA